MACTLTHSQQLVAAAHAWQHVMFPFPAIFAGQQGEGGQHVLFLSPAMFAGQQGEGEVIKRQMCKQWQHVLFHTYL